MSDLPVDGDPAPQRTELVDLEPRSALLLLAAGLAAAAVLAVVRQAPGTLTQVFLGMVLALALDPVVVRIQARTGGRRGTAVALVGALLALAAGALLVVVGPAAIEQASSLRDDLPATIEEAYSWPIIGPELAERDLAAEVDDAINRLPARLGDAELTRYAETLLGGALSSVIVLVTAVAVMLDGATIVDRARRVVGRRRRHQLDAIGRVVYATFGNYFAGSLFVAVLNGLVTLTLALALGIPLAPLVGLWSMLTNLIPQIGGFLGGSFLVMLALTQGPVTAAVALVVFLVYQNVENNVIQPAVVGRAVDLSPPATMLAALVGGAVAGVPGALVATPILGTLKVLVVRDTDAGIPRGELELEPEPTPVEGSGDGPA